MDWQNFWDSLMGGLLRFAQDAALAALIFLGGWLLARLASRVTRKAVAKGRVDALAAGFIGSLVKAVVLAVAAVSAVAQLGVRWAMKPARPPAATC